MKSININIIIMHYLLINETDNNDIYHASPRDRDEVIIQCDWNCLLIIFPYRYKFPLNISPFNIRSKAEPIKCTALSTVRM